jgi:hypothetical protein
MARCFYDMGSRLLKIYRGEKRERMPAGKPGAVVWVGSDFIEVAAEGFLPYQRSPIGGRRK